MHRAHRSTHGHGSHAKRDANVARLTRSGARSLGSDGFRRLRVGVGRPEERDSATVAAYVLSTMPADELELATRAFEQPEIRARLLRPGGGGS